LGVGGLAKMVYAENGRDWGKIHPPKGIISDLEYKHWKKPGEAGGVLRLQK